MEHGSTCGEIAVITVNAVISLSSNNVLSVLSKTHDSKSKIKHKQLLTSNATKKSEKNYSE